MARRLQLKKVVGFERPVHDGELCWYAGIPTACEPAQALEHQVRAAGNHITKHPIKHLTKQAWRYPIKKYQKTSSTAGSDAIPGQSIKRACATSTVFEAERHTLPCPQYLHPWAV